MKIFMKLGAILTFTLFYINASEFAISGINNVYKAEEARKSIRDYYHIDSTTSAYKTVAMNISYANDGGYVVKSAKLKLKRNKNNTIIYSERRTSNLEIGNAYIWSIRYSTKLNKNESYTLDIKYKISGGDTKHCKKTFIFNDTDVMWLVKSKGTTLNGNGCKNITFQQK